MARTRRLHKRYGKKRRSDGGGTPSFRRNPPVLTELMEFVLPGFAGFAATRFLTRVVSVQIAKRKPTWAKHAGALASIGSFLAAWYGANRVKMLEKHHTPLVVGSAIAAIQSIIQLYIPALGWVIADASPEIAAEQDHLTVDAGVTQQAQQQIAASNLKPTNDDPAWYTFDESYDAGRYSPINTPGAGGASAPRGSTAKANEEALLDDLGMGDDLSVSGWGSN